MFHYMSYGYREIVVPYGWLYMTLVSHI